MQVINALLYLIITHSRFEKERDLSFFKQDDGLNSLFSLVLGFLILNIKQRNTKMKYAKIILEDHTLYIKSKERDYLLNIHVYFKQKIILRFSYPNNIKSCTLSAIYFI